MSSIAMPFDRSDSPLLSELDLGEKYRTLDVRVSYEIIKLFSEGLYGSPHKAVEELVSNSYDAGARTAHVLMPSTGEAGESLWVIDDGCGMDEKGFEDLWKIAYSPKSDQELQEGQRLPIGQFGIGKLAAYVLAWHLTHVSKILGSYFFTSMDFHLVEKAHQWKPIDKPIAIELRRVDENEARKLLAEVERRDASAWTLLFGEDAARTWTAAALTEFKDLADKLREGTLSWVLRTGLPVTGDFSIHLNGKELVPAKVDWTRIMTLPVGGDDAEARKLEISASEEGISIPGIGAVTGEARLYERQLAGGKSDQYNRSRGFFVRVRKRVINLEDELFGLDVLNHAAWAHFMMEIEADGLRHYLLSSREGVREGQPIRLLREYLHEKFNTCRRKFDAVRLQQLVGLDIHQLLSEAPSSLVTQPLLEALQIEIEGEGRQLYYIHAPADIEGDAAREWLDEFETAVSARPFEDVQVAKEGAYAPLAKYDAANRRVIINEDHPLIVKLHAHSKNQTPMTLFATSEILTDAMVRRFGLDTPAALALFEMRDHVLRLLAGEHAPVAADAMRWLEIADQDDTAMERAVGAAFEILGFHHEKRGGYAGGTDGVLTARLGRQGGALADYKMVFDAKTTNSPRIPAGKVDFAALHRFQVQEGAQFAFVIGKAFQGEEDPSSKINEEAENEKVSVLRTRDLQRLVELHVRYGVTLTQLRGLFLTYYSLPRTSQWIESVAGELAAADSQVPVKALLDGLEELKDDVKSPPTVSAVRQVVSSLKQFEPEKLEATIRALRAMVGPKWVELDERRGAVYLHQSPDQIIAEAHRVLSAEFGEDHNKPPPV